MFLEELGEEWRRDLVALPAWRTISIASEQTRKAVVLELLRHIRRRVRGTRYEYETAVSMWSSAIDELSPESPMYRSQPMALTWSAAELAALCREVASALDESRICARQYTAQRWVHLAERTGALGDPQLRQALRELAAALQRNAVDRETHSMHRGLYEDIARMLDEPGLVAPDAWRRTLDADPSPVAAALLALATTAPASPSARFANQRAAVVERLGPDAALERTAALLRAAAATRPASDEAPVMAAATTELLRGLVHIAAGFDQDVAADAIADLGITAYRKVAHFGACSATLGTACSRALARRPEALAQLARMQQRTSHPPSKAKLDKLLLEAAERLGVTAAELTEIVVPDFGLDFDGRTTRVVGDTTVRIAVEGETVSTGWTNAAGRTTKTPPAELREQHAEEIAEAKALAKGVRGALGVQRARLESLMSEDREWPLHTWQVRYLEHGLVGTLARRLVWRFADADGECSAIWHDGQLVDMLGRPLPAATAATRVRPWHPAGALPGEVAALDRLLAERGITPPFAQVRRDVFLPDDGDLRAQAVGRFRGIRVRQHQLAAILKGRGWRYELRSAAWDSDDSPTLELPAWGLTATLTLAQSREDEPASERSIVLGVTCEELVFSSAGTGVPPADVPLVVFSEVVRDVALVAAAAADDDASGD